jgi:tetratricopeptide (TPR) repeat protein
VRATGRWLLALSIVAAALAGAATPARAGRLDEAWRRGNQAYLHGDYRAAVAAYQELRDQGVHSSDLFFNLGDAYVRTGALGPAIWAFEEALVLDPGNEDARYNLAATRKQAARLTPAANAAETQAPGQDHDPLWVRIVTSLSASAETWLFAAAYLGLFGLLFWRVWARADLRAGLAVAATALGVAALLTGALLVGRVQLDRMSFGVVLPDAVEVREGADPGARTSFALHAGARVRLVDADQDWVRVRLGNGLEGWLRANEVGKL